MRAVVLRPLPALEWVTRLGELVAALLRRFGFASSWARTASSDSIVAMNLLFCAISSLAVLGFHFTYGWTATLTAEIVSASVVFAAWSASATFLVHDDDDFGGSVDGDFAAASVFLLGLCVAVPCALLVTAYCVPGSMAEMAMVFLICAAAPIVARRTNYS